eukprot:TRINITY_DN10651_c0_g1_i11.p2 TRINITY_DN10651_c0_g1~~TRINITY_DN10651_c0_g1_i11.p2  ORF type:complete len:165 (+),score=47.35 TRINITY_DN10651_c0_g1_i11:648-1142(+)
MEKVQEQKLKAAGHTNRTGKERAPTMEPECHSPQKEVVEIEKGNGYVAWEKDGNEYRGNMLNGLPNGYGTFIWANGNRYEGDWKEGRPHGHGKMYYKNGASYEGEYIQGERSGQGKFITPDGDTYDGLWLHDKKNGTVTISGPGKSTILTTWKDDAILNAQEKV